MKKLVTAVCCILALQASAGNNGLIGLITARAYPQMEKALQDPALSHDQKDLYRVFLLNAYGQAAQSAALIEKVRSRQNIKTGDSLDYFLHVTACDNHVKLCAYEKAATEARLLVTRYTHFYSEKDLEDEKQAAAIWELLAKEKPQTLIKQSLSVLAFTKDMAGLWRIPVTMGDTTVKFIFDTGAGLSTISRSTARKMGVRLLDSAWISIKSGITGIATRVQLGMAAHLELGPGIVAQNVVFLVFPDEALRFANGAYTIEGIIGLPLIRQLESFAVQEGEIIIPQKPFAHKVQPNMILDLLKPVIYMQYHDRLLPFTFDSGANTSSFNNNFYETFRSDIDSVGVKKTVSVGGTGGVLAKEIIEVPSLSFRVHDRTAVFPKAEISLSEISTNGKIYYGNIGQDLIRQFKKMTVSFTGSYILFE